MNRRVVAKIEFRRLKIVQNHYIKSRFKVSVRIMIKFFYTSRNEIILYYRLSFSNKQGFEKNLLNVKNRVAISHTNA